MVRLPDGSWIGSTDIQDIDQKTSIPTVSKASSSFGTFPGKN
jgi:hypothetical protein